MYDCAESASAMRSISFATIQNMGKRGMLPGCSGGAFEMETGG